MRYTGPKWKINRREGFTVLGTTQKWRRRPGLPGQFPVLKKRPSEYSLQFREKQKVKRMFGMSESQFKKFYNMAVKARGDTGLLLLQLLETRIDNVLYRLGLALTRAQARQFVSHGHVKLNGKIHNIPSTNLKVGDTVQISEKFANSPIVGVIESSVVGLTIPKWLKQIDKGGVILSMPERSDIDASINERLIVELYSK
ncbi:30S ribosomal protein S4 [Candidatus Dojkabacteria bacterium]|uniref:Small ribosomal subunit protein uS4 n=1 Tax=Candidatus Dojkabacteria bacterium TaxID=2099670 RepID=A0A3M0YX32_9BACT|nr:MAG: 30S ribosomal protein S4 [Candidatus Dojkabacteria bacterium]